MIQDDIVKRRARVLMGVPCYAMTAASAVEPEVFLMKKRIVSLLLLAALVLGSMLGLTSCGEEDEGAQISVYLTDRVYGFDPAADFVDDSVLSVMYLLYEPLFSLDDDGDIHPALAKKYDYDKKTATLTVELRETYWSNGSRVLAKDVIYAWKRLLNPGKAFPAATLLYDIKNAYAIKNATSGEDASYVSLDDLGVWSEKDGTILKIAFEHEDTNVDAFLRNLTYIATAPVHYETVDAPDSRYTWSNGTSSSCYTNGPFLLRQLDSQQGYFTLARNDGYHRPEDSGKSVDHFVLPYFLRTQWNVSDEASDTDHLAEQYDLLMQKVTKAVEHTVFYMAELTLEDRKAAEKKAVVNDSMSTYTYVFNNDNPLFGDPQVRSILSKVLDRQAIVDLITFGRPATGLVSYGVWNAKSGSNGQSFRKKGGNLISATAELSVDEAKAKLNEIGAATGAFTLTCLDREEHRTIAEYVKAQWEALGYTVTIEPVSAATIRLEGEPKEGSTSESDNATETKVSHLQYRYAHRDFDVIGIDYQMMSTNAFSVLATLTSAMNGNGYDWAAYSAATDKNGNFAVGNYAGYRSEAYDTLIRQAYETGGLKARAELLHRAEEQLLADMPIIPLVFNQNFYVVNKSYLKNLTVNYYGYTLFTDAKLKKYTRFFMD